MNIEESLYNAQNLMDSIDKKMNGVVLPGHLRSKVFHSLLHLSLEHFGSIVILVKSRMNGSAYALLRPQYEAVIRGLYFQNCADQKEIELFIAGENPYGLYTMIKKIDGKLDIDSFKNFYTLVKNVIHTYTHGGIEQLERRYTENELVSNFTENECISLIELSSNLARTSAIFSALVAGREDIVEAFFPEIKNKSI